MSAEKFTSRPVPSQASPALREYLEDQISRLQLLANGAALREEEETITGDWTFSGSLTIPQASVTDHQAALTILETQITDGSLLARVADNETISGDWTYSNPVLFANGAAASPSLAFSADTATGIYRDSTFGFIGFALAGTLSVQVGATGIQLRNGLSMYLDEKAAANTDFTGRGQLWVKNTTPCQLWFTDDAGNDTQIV